MLDLDLLRSFVSVVETGGFTRAGRARSPHPIDREPADQAAGGHSRLPAAASERQTGHADRGGRAARVLRAADSRAWPRRRAMSSRGRKVKVSCGSAFPRISPPIVSTKVLSDSPAHARPETRCALRSERQVAPRPGARRARPRAHEARRGRNRRASRPGPKSCNWVTSRSHPIDPSRDSVPLAVFPQGCLYRNRAVHALETAGRAWHIAYTSPNFAGIQAAVSAGLGVSILPEVAMVRRPSRAHVKGRIPRDHEYGAGTGGGARRRPRDSPPRRPAGRFLQRRRSTTGGVIFVQSARHRPAARA